MRLHGKNGNQTTIFFRITDSASKFLIIFHHFVWFSFSRSYLAAYISPRRRQLHSIAGRSLSETFVGSVVAGFGCGPGGVVLGSSAVGSVVASFGRGPGCVVSGSSAFKEIMMPIPKPLTYEKMQRKYYK